MVVNNNLVNAAKKKYEAQIDSLKNITNEISVKVKEQYEENPYPRWKNTGLYIHPISISEFVKTSKLKVKNIKLLILHLKFSLEILLDHLQHLLYNKLHLVN